MGNKSGRSGKAVLLAGNLQVEERLKRVMETLRKGCTLRRLVQIPPLSLNSCEALGNLFNHSRLQFPLNCKMGIEIKPHRILEIMQELIHGKST